MNAYTTIEVARSKHVADVRLARPEVHNALNETSIRELTDAFQALGSNAAVYVIVLSGKGPSFSAGADVNWMKGMIAYGFDENLRDAKGLARMFDTIDRCPKPVVARVHGAALGGGAGLAAAADITVAAEGARFGFTEVRLGIIPAVISPYVLARIGATRAREYFLTGERFDARRAAEIALVDHVVPEEHLDQEIHRIVAEILKCAPEAVSAAKALIAEVICEPDRRRATELTARRIAERRVSAEGQEGMRAFLEKRPPSWLG
ncbi:MAG: enoyl-CoA hydratase-related protein [Planctomycetes bacterium]|nr:enoyl-CoA hydratase-related protein [Planctomycetota bacterium]